MEAVERYLFKVGVEDQQCIVLLIDEAQILPDFVFEILRILLNYETNEYKILQLVLVGQMELLPRISGISNFWDRVALKYVLNPLGEDEVRQMIRYRLKQAGYTGEDTLFTDEAVKRLYDHTQGYPRKLSLLCHNALESLVMFDKRVVDGDVADAVIRSDVKPLVLAAERASQPPCAGQGSVDELDIGDAGEPDLEELNVVD
jgi:type II secretory pathway predicted ATPase ExeA